MKVLYHIPYLVTPGADHWIYLGWKHAFEDIGHEFVPVCAGDDWQAKVRANRPDLIFIPNFIDLPRLKKTLKDCRISGIKVFLTVDWPLSMGPEALEIIKTEEVADCYFGEREPESMREFERSTGRQYHTVPQAADRRLHFPTQPCDKYRYDIVFIGAYLPKKRKMFEEILFPLKRKYQVGIFGPYWTFGDNVLRAAQKMCRAIQLTSGVEWINAKRVAVPAEEENRLYSSARICVNFHEREEDGSQPHYLVNQRTFKISACGGFQICDHVPALRKYFEGDEVVMAEGPRDWFDKIEYFLANEGERERIRQKAAARALRDHTFHNRVGQVLRLAEGTSS